MTPTTKVKIFIFFPDINCVLSDHIHIVYHFLQCINIHLGKWQVQNPMFITTMRTTPNSSAAFHIFVLADRYGLLLNLQYYDLLAAIILYRTSRKLMKSNHISDFVKHHTVTTWLPTFSIFFKTKCNSHVWFTEHNICWSSLQWKHRVHKMQLPIPWYSTQN